MSSKSTTIIGMRVDGLTYTMVETLRALLVTTAPRIPGDTLLWTQGMLVADDESLTSATYENGCSLFTRLGFLDIVVAYLAHFNTYQRTSPANYALVEDYYGKRALTWLMIETPREI